MKYTSESKEFVLIDGLVIPRQHRLWVELGVGEAEASGGVSPWMTQAEKDADAQIQAREAFKQSRSEAMNILTVETLKGVFDADETSQTRMSRAIAVMSDTDLNVWVLTDNTPIEVTKADLVEALILAGKAQSALWVQP